MTINNNNINPFPTSNPYTSRLYGNNNCCWNNSGFVHCSQDQKVPDAKPFTMEDKQYWDDVSVPNGEDVPMGCEGYMNIMPQFNRDLFKCPDGTIINLKTKKVISQVQVKEGYWGDGRVRNSMTRDDNTWNDNEIMSISPHQMVNGQVEMSKSDIEYNEMLKQKDMELKNNMNDEQKSLLDKLENGGFILKSRLIEEK